MLFLFSISFTYESNQVHTLFVGMFLNFFYSRSFLSLFVPLNFIYCLSWSFHVFWILLTSYLWYICHVLWTYCAFFKYLRVCCTWCSFTFKHFTVFFPKNTALFHNYYCKSQKASSETTCYLSCWCYLDFTKCPRSFFTAKRNLQLCVAFCVPSIHLCISWCGIFEMDFCRVSFNSYLSAVSSRFNRGYAALVMLCPSQCTVSGGTWCGHAPLWVHSSPLVSLVSAIFLPCKAAVSPCVISILWKEALNLCDYPVTPQTFTHGF